MKKMKEIKEKKEVKHRRRLTDEEKKQVFKMYAVGVSRMPKKVLYNKIAVLYGCGWQCVYNCVHRELLKRQYKIVFEE